MYTIKIRRNVDRNAARPPDAVMGTLPTLELARRFAAMCRRFEYVATAWIEYEGAPLDTVPGY